MKRKPSRAGGYAAKQALTIRRNWRDKATPKARLFFWPLIASGVLGIAFARPNAAGVLFGFLIGAGIMGYASLLEDVPDAAFHWERGSEGERRTESRLLPLEEEGWFVFHDIQRSGRNWDHVVVGPPGVFLLETKDRKGELRLVDSSPQLVINDTVLNDPKIRQWPNNVKSEAAALFEEVEKVEGVTEWVDAVLVYWGTFPDRVVELNKITYVHGDELARWLRGKPERLTRGTQALVAAAVEQIAEARPGA